MNQVVAYMLDGEDEKADQLFQKLVQQGENTPQFGTTLGQLYANMGSLELFRSTAKARDYFIKAKKAYETHLSADDQNIQAIDHLLYVIDQGQLFLPQKLQ